MIDVTVDYVGQREQFGKVVGSFQAVKHHMSNVAGVEFARPMVYVAAYAVANATPHRDVKSPRPRRWRPTRRSRCRLALQCHGAIGYTFEYDLHLWMKRHGRCHRGARRSITTGAAAGALTPPRYRRQWEAGWSVVNCGLSAPSDAGASPADSQLSQVRA